MLKILFSILLLLAGIQIPARADFDEKKQLERKFNQFADEVNCQVANYLQNAPGVTKANKIDCSNCNYEIFKEQIKNSRNKEIAEYFNKIKVKYCENINSKNVNNFIDEYIKYVIDTIHTLRSKQSNYESWEKEVTSKKNLFKVDINNILIIINMNDSLKSVMENLALEYDKKGKENINDSGAANEGGVSKFWNYLKYGSLISFILILFAWLFIEYRNLIRKIKEKDKTIKELKSQLQSANIKLNQSVDKGSESFLKSKNSLVKPIASSEILDDAIVKLKNNPPNIAGSILLSLIDNNRNAWLDKLESEYNGKFNVRDTDKAQFILDYVKHDVERIVKDDYYDLKRVVELLDVQNLLGGQEWLKKYKKIAPERAEQIAKNKANELQVKLPNNSLIAKLEFDKLKTESLKEIEIAIREEEANMDTIMYSSQPVGEGYFIKEKLSDEILGQHMYKILISTKNPDTARFQFLFDNEKAMKTAIASYSTALVPVCILEKDNTKGERIVPTQDNGFGTLRLENDRWKVQEKLRIRIV